MSSPPEVEFPISVIDDAEIAGWRCLAVSCGCRITHLDWRTLRRLSRYRRFDEIIPRLRCQSCGSYIKSAALYWLGGSHNHEKRERLIFESGQAR